MSQYTDAPLVSCLMVTKNRVALAERAIRCFVAQTYPHTELVIIDDGDQNYSEMLGRYRDAADIRYLRVPAKATTYLGDLRNMSLDAARGEYCAQWDDDEWYHPTRLQRQVDALHDQELDAVVLKETLMHVDMPELAHKPYRVDVGKGTPGTILHRRASVRYPNLRRSEDSEFLDELRTHMSVGLVEGAHSHLFIRCYHGGNTWEEEHFRKRLRRTPLKLLQLAKARLIDGDLFAHPAFDLTAVEREAAAQFFIDSHALGLFKHVPVPPEPVKSYAARV